MWRWTVAALLSGLVLQDPDPIPRTSHPVELDIKSFRHPPHGIKGPVKAIGASSFLRGDRIVFLAEGPRSKEGPYFRLRFSMPLGLLKTGTVDASLLWVSYGHGGEGGLEICTLDSKKGGLTLISDERGVRGSFNLEFKFMKVGEEPSLESQRLEGVFQLLTGWELLLKAVADKSVTAILETDLLDLLEEQRVGRAPFRQVGRTRDGGWKITYMSNGKVHLDRRGNVILVKQK